MALEGARYRAMAKLVENLRGMDVAKTTTVKDLVFASEEVEVNILGQLEGVQLVKAEYDEKTGIAEVTVRVGLDSRGGIVPSRMLPIMPLSLAARRARAESAACVDAVASLRGQIGEVHVGQVVKVKNLVLEHQEAWLLVEGILEGVKFSEPHWPSNEQCVIGATVTMTPDQLQRLRSMTQGTMAGGS